MKKISLSLIIILVGSTIFASEKLNKSRKPSAENFTSHIGAITVNVSPGETAGIFIKGDAAQGLFNAMRDVKPTLINKGNILKSKSGATVTCNHIKKVEGGTNDGYECVFSDFNSSGGFVD